jgi:hypothetical protein
MADATGTPSFLFPGPRRWLQFTELEMDFSFTSNMRPIRPRWPGPSLIAATKDIKQPRPGRCLVIHLGLLNGVIFFG